MIAMQNARSKSDGEGRLGREENGIRLGERNRTGKRFLPRAKAQFMTRQKRGGKDRWKQMAKKEYSANSEGGSGGGVRGN